MKSLALMTALAVLACAPAYAQSAAGTAGGNSSVGTTTGPVTGTPDNPTGEPSRKIDQPLPPGQQPTQRQSSTDVQGQQMPGQSPGHQNQQAANQGSQVPSTHQLKQMLQASGFQDPKIMAESFVIQATKDGRPVTLFLGPNRFSAFTVLDPNGLSGSDEVTGSLNRGTGQDMQGGSMQNNDGSQSDDDAE